MKTKFSLSEILEVFCYSLKNVFHSTMHQMCQNRLRFIDIMIWSNNFNAILSCTKLRPERSAVSFLMLPCQNSIIDQDSFSMLQTDTLQFTQIAQTIDKLVFHLARTKKSLFSSGKWKIFNRKIEGKNNFSDQKNEKFSCDSLGTRSFAMKNS